VTSSKFRPVGHSTIQRRTVHQHRYIPSAMFRAILLPALALLGFLFNALLASGGVLYKSDSGFEVDLSALELQRHIQGGAGGVYVLKGPQNALYTLKMNRDRSNFEEELIADKLYLVLGVSVPRFLIVNDYTSLPAPIQETISSAPFVRIAEFVEADTHGSRSEEAEGELAKHFRETFVVDAFLANRDANKDGNNIFKGGTFYRIDNGGSLRNRAVGKKKGTKRADHWDARLIPELKSLVKYRPDLYGSLTEDVIVSQAQRILEKAGELMASLKLLTTVLSTESSVVGELQSMLQHRLRMLEMIVHAGSAFPAEMERAVTALTGAGAMLICDVNNTTSVLLGERKNGDAGRDRKWVTCGGKSDFPEDPNLVTTVQREIYEESMGLIDIKPDLLRDAPFFDFVHVDYFFRQYFVRLDQCPDAEVLLVGEVPRSLKHNRHTGVVEYHRFKWFPLELLQRVSEVGTMGDTEYTAYHAFASLLQVPHVQALLKQLREGRPITEHRFMQAMPARDKEAPVYATFT
jgi:8-oxo-dGTP pyrophosphatase MutT (NUDIX family)